MAGAGAHVRGIEGGRGRACEGRNEHAEERGGEEYKDGKSLEETGKNIHGGRKWGGGCACRREGGSGNGEGREDTQC
eukprot:766969-Hanusia_phi.AAC.1